MALALVRPDLLYAWKGPSLLIVGVRGDCSSDQPLSGFYFREARFLQTLRLEINGERPWLCEAAAVDPESLAFNFVHPEITMTSLSMIVGSPSARWTSGWHTTSASPRSTSCWW